MSTVSDIAEAQQVWGTFANTCMISFRTCRSVQRQVYLLKN